MKKTILLVDDEIDILDIQNRYLIQAGLVGLLGLTTKRED